MANSNGTIVWKLIATTCVGIIVTGAGAWMVFGQDKVTRSEMIEYVQNQAPWARDRQSIQLEIKSNAKGIGTLQGAVDQLVKAQQDLVV